MANIIEDTVEEPTARVLLDTEYRLGLNKKLME